MTASIDPATQDLPPAQSCRLIEFERADVISVMMMPPRPVLVVSGRKPFANMRVELVPLRSLIQPPYQGIEVVGCMPAIGQPAIVPYTVQLDLNGVGGRHGIEVIGANQTERIELEPSIDTEQPIVESDREVVMANAGQPTVGPGATGPAVSQAQRALRRTPNFALTVDGIYGAETEAAARQFQQSAGLPVDGIVGPSTWAALPDGNPMPTLSEGARGDVVVSLQQVLTNGAPGQWKITPKGVDGQYGPNTKASVMALQGWIGLKPDGVVGQQTWDSINASLETAVGLRFIVP